MLLALLPLSVPFWLCSPSAAAAALGISCTLCLADVTIQRLLHGLFPQRQNAVLLFWWFSPLVLCCNYWVGQLDCIPVSFCCAAFLCLKSQRFRLAGLLLAGAISCKLSMALTLPFVACWFLRNRRLWGKAIPFCSAFFLCAVLLHAIPLFSHGYRVMALGTPELGRLFDLRLPLGDVFLVLTPLLYLCTVYAAWRTNFLNFNLLTAFTALGFTVVVLGTSTPPGWHMWAWPFLVMQLARMEGPQRLLGCAYSACAAMGQVLFWPPPAGVGGLPLPHDCGYPLYLSCQCGIGFLLSLGVLRYNVREQEMFRFGRVPISIGIAGDSGTGKDTLAEHLIGLFGGESVTHISGDDYHRWDRRNASWRMVTHLNPRANDLQRFFADIHSVMHGKRIVRRRYQHHDGHFSQRFTEKSRRILIVSGLHTLLSGEMNARFDVRVFMEMDEHLRAFFKCRRDSGVRGHTYDAVVAEMQRRGPDGQRYIAPAKKHADIIFTRTAVHPVCVAQGIDTPPSILSVRLRRSFGHEALVRQLVSLCGLHVEVSPLEEPEDILLTVDGDIRAEDMAYLAGRFMPQLEELLELKPAWSDGVYGLMQLVTLFQLAQNLRNQQ